MCILNISSVTGMQLLREDTTRVTMFNRPCKQPFLDNFQFVLKMKKNISKTKQAPFFPET